jgi:hypothetical protein
MSNLILKQKSFSVLSIICTMAVVCLTPVFAQDKPIPKEYFFKMGSGGDGYNEVWTYNVYLDNGTKLWINYSLVKSSMGGSESGSDIAVYNFKGKQYSVARSYEMKHRYTEDRASGKIIIKNEENEAFYMAGFPGNGHKFHFETEKGAGFYVDLQMSQAVAGVMPTNNGYYPLAKGKKAGTYIHVPYAQVSGKLAIGKDTVNVKGWAMMEHSWLNDLPAPKIAGKFGLLNKGLGALNYGYAVEIAGGKASVIPATEVLADYKAFRSDSPLPGNFTIKTENSVWNMKRTADQVVFSPLDNIDGWMAKKAVKFLMGGEIRLHRGVGTDASGLPIEYNMLRIK